MREGAAFAEFPQVGRLPDPERWLAEYGYGGRCRYLGIWWECAGDEAAWSDGYSSMAGAWWPPLLALSEQIGGQVAAAAPGDPRGQFVIGSSDEPGTHWLLLDRQTGEIRLGEQGPAREFLMRSNRVEDAPIPAGLRNMLARMGWMATDPPAEEG